MRIKDAPLGFVTGGTLSPRALNENLNHLASTVEDTAEQRYVHYKVRLPYFKTLAAGYSNSDSDAVREYVLNLPSRWSVERAFLRWYGLGTADVTVDRYEGTTLVEAGYLGITPAASNSSLADFNGTRTEHDADTDYRFRMVGTAFTSAGTFLELHIRVDRFNTDGTDGAPSYTPARITSADARDADVLNAELTSIDTETAKITAATTFSKMELYVAHSVDDAHTVAEYTWHLPRVDSDETKRTAVKMIARRVQNTAPGASTGCTWTLVDDTGTDTALTVSLSGTDADTSDSAAATVAMSDASASLDDSGDGYTLELEHDVGTATIDKTYCLLLYS